MFVKMALLGGLVKAKPLSNYFRGVINPVMMISVGIVTSIFLSHCVYSRPNIAGMFYQQGYY